MRKKFIALIAVSALFLPVNLFAMEGTVIGDAGHLTIKQENLRGLPNQFVVVVEPFPQDGMLTPESVKTAVETQLMTKGIKIVDDLDISPLSKINVNVNLVEGENAQEVYAVDLNIYNLNVIRTRYELRKGTIWMLGSFNVTPGPDFPKGVERQVSRMVNYFINDYYKANRYQKKPDAVLKEEIK